MRRLSVTGLACLILLSCFALGLSRPAAATEATVDAFSAWQGRGQVFETGPKQMTYVGSFSGMLYIDGEEGPLDAGFMVCPGVFTVDMDSGAQTGTARCTLTGREGNRVYGELTCTGKAFMGCKGDFKITGGTGPFDGITGGGPVSIRSSLRDIIVAGGNTVADSSAGIIFWKGLHYKMK